MDSTCGRIMISRNMKFAEISGIRMANVMMSGGETPMRRIAKINARSAAAIRRSEGMLNGAPVGR